MRHACAWCLLLIAGCGGQIRKSEADDAATPTGASGNGSSMPGNLSLPDCNKGFDPNEQPMKSCDFVVEGLCYESKIAACACACPRDRSNTNCSSGFPIPDGHVLVTCH